MFGDVWCANWHIAFSAAALKRQVHLPTTNKYSREPCECTNPQFHSLSPVQYKNLLLCDPIALFLPQCTGSSKTNLLLSCPLNWTIICSNARSQAASSLSARRLCCTTTWSTITHRATQAPLAASRHAPQTNRTTARRPLAGAAPSRLPTVSAHFVYSLFVWAIVFCLDWFVQICVCV